MSGIFLVNREIFENSIWNNVAEFRLFFYILGQAIWKDEGVYKGTVFVGRGQYLRSYRKLREDLMYIENNAIKYYGIATIKRLVDKLVQDERLEVTETELGTLFTVLNYSSYQTFNQFNQEDSEQQRNSNGTATEQQRNNKKKVKKVNNDNNELIKNIVSYLNEKAGKKYQPTTAKTITLINSRLEEGYTVEDFKKVIDVKVSSWGNTDFEKYLRPTTLFNGEKFEGYLNEGTAIKQDIPRWTTGSDRLL